MSNIKIESTSSESPSTKREVVPKTEKPGIKEVSKVGSLSLKMKIILFGSIGLTILLIAGIVLIVTLHSKTDNEYKMEISDLKTEKEVLENKNSKLRNEIQYLTKSNSDLNKKLNDQSVQGIKEEQKKNETYQTLDVISKEGASLKTTFAKITNNIEKIKVVENNRYQQEQTQGQTQEQDPNRELEEDVNTLKNQLELIQALMAQISLNLDLINQNKELLSTNIDLSRQLNQQIINNTLLLSENQNLIREKINLNDKLQTQIEINDILKLKIEQLENELNKEKERFNKTCIVSCTSEEDKKKIEELSQKVNEEIDNNKLLKNEISNLQQVVDKKNSSLQKCLNEQEELKEEKETLNSNIQNLYNNINELIANNTNLFNENILLKSENIKFNTINENLNKSLDVCKDENKNLSNIKENLQIDYQNLSQEFNQIKNNLTYCENKIAISELNDNKLTSELNQCKINSSNLANENKILTNSYNSLNQQFSQCKTNLNNYINNYNVLSKENSDLRSQIKTLTSQKDACINNYNSCQNQLAYYIKLPNEIKNLKEQITKLTNDYYECSANLKQCYNDCPYVEYTGITDAMRQTFLELITYAYAHYSNNQEKAKYVAERMTAYYNKAYWSCILAKPSSYYGYYVWYRNNLYYTHRYKSIDWVIFVGSY